MKCRPSMVLYLTTTLILMQAVFAKEMDLSRSSYGHLRPAKLRAPTKFKFEVRAKERLSP
jgi:hypothetical protein